MGAIWMTSQAPSSATITLARGCGGEVCEFACTSEGKSTVDALYSNSCFAISVLT